MATKEATREVSKDAANPKSSPQVTPILNKRPEHKLLYCGIDDGHYATKICLEDGTTFYMPSRAAVGLQQIVSLNGDEDTAYETGHNDGDETFTVIEDYALIAAVDTRFTEPPYAVSGLNRAIVFHALVRAGLGGKSLAAVTGLPVDNYFLRGEKNTELIERKVANLVKGSVRNKNPNVNLPKIVRHNVIAEGVAAFFDLLLDMKGNENQDIVRLIADRAMAVIDVGGKTTDIALVTEGGQSLYPERSGTQEVGALDLNDKVAARLRSRFNLSSVVPHKHVEKAIQTRVYSLYGAEHDVSDIVDQEAHAFANEIASYMRKLVRDGSDIGSVVFVGGGSILLRPWFEKIYPHQAMFPDNPEYANARGMLKAAKYIYGEDD